MQGLNGVRPRRPEQSAWISTCTAAELGVSMESGLEGRNNARRQAIEVAENLVSMESGLEGRNNASPRVPDTGVQSGLNGVRPRRPEQFGCAIKSGLGLAGLNGVRPRRPEQSAPQSRPGASRQRCLNGVRPRRPEQLGVSLATGGGGACLNGVRPRRPEQSGRVSHCCTCDFSVSMESGLEGRNNTYRPTFTRTYQVSQWSPA